MPKTKHIFFAAVFFVALLVGGLPDIVVAGEFYKCSCTYTEQTKINPPMCAVDKDTMSWKLGDTKDIEVGTKQALDVAFVSKGDCFGIIKGSFDMLLKNSGICYEAECVLEKCVTTADPKTGAQGPESCEPQTPWKWLTSIGQKDNPITLRLGEPVKPGTKIEATGPAKIEYKCTNCLEDKSGAWVEEDGTVTWDTTETGEEAMKGLISSGGEDSINVMAYDPDDKDDYLEATIHFKINEPDCGSLADEKSCAGNPLYCVFVDGKCKYKGTLSEADFSKVSGEITKGFLESTHPVPDDYVGALPPCAFYGTCRSINDLTQLLINFGKGMFAIMGSFAFAFFVYGGFTMIVSMGNAEKQKKGMQILVSAVIGIVIAFSAYMLINFMLEALDVAQDFRGIK